MRKKQQYNKYTRQYVYGFHAVKTALENTRHEVNELYLLIGRNDARSRELMDLAKKRDIPCKFLTRFELDQLVDFVKHQGFVAWSGDSGGGVERVGNSERDLEQLIRRVGNQAFFLVLDGVQDPHNLGACLRTANGAGVDAVIIAKDNAVGLTDTVAKVACGAAETTPLFQVTNLARTLRLLKEHNIWIYGTALEAEQSIYEVKLRPPLALVLGAEETGLRRLTREQCDFLFKIPMFGTVESLNVSVATGICLFEVVRELEVGE